MSKGNLFLGFARGKVGDVVFSHVNGEQVTRARNRKPKNRQTALQMLQRVVMKTNSTAYSLMQEICNHSFQGFAEGTRCQSRFAELNVQMLRDSLSEEINSGNPEDIFTSSKTNFAGKSVQAAEINPYIISEGKLPSTVCNSRANHMGLVIPGATAAADVEAMTYQDIVDALGIRKGDQLTFIVMTCDDTEAGAAGTFNGFHYARVILEPNDGDMTTVFLGTGEAEGTIQKPNVKNEGSMTFKKGIVNSDLQQYGIRFEVPSATNAGGVKAPIAIACIVSRWDGNVWARSSQSLHILTGAGAYDHEIDLLSDAIASYMVGADSSLYLNQADF